MSEWRADRWPIPDVLRPRFDTDDKSGQFRLCARWNSRSPRLDALTKITRRKTKCPNRASNEDFSYQGSNVYRVVCVGIGDASWQWILRVKTTKKSFVWEHMLSYGGLYVGVIPSRDENSWTNSIYLFTNKSQLLSILFRRYFLASESLKTRNTEQHHCWQRKNTLPENWTMRRSMPEGMWRDSQWWNVSKLAFRCKRRSFWIRYSRTYVRTNTFFIVFTWFQSMLRNTLYNPKKKKKKKKERKKTRLAFHSQSSIFLPFWIVNRFSRYRHRNL